MYAFCRFLIFSSMILLACSLSAQDEQLTNPQDKQKFREFIQEGKGYYEFPEAPISKAELNKIIQVKAPWDKNPVDFLEYFDQIVKTEAHADKMSSWLIWSDEEAYVIALESFAKIYAKTALHDRFLKSILHAECDKEDFLEINYRNKHIQKFCKLLVEKMEADNPLLKEVKSILSGKDLAMTIQDNLESMVDRFFCRILSRDDWAEEFKQWGPPYEVQAAQIQKCIEQFRAIDLLLNEEDPAVVLQKITPALKEALKQLKVLNSYKQTESKEDWNKLIFFFKELTKVVSPERKVSDEKRAKGEAYIAAHPKEKEELVKIVMEIDEWVYGANAFQEWIMILATKKAQAEIDAEIEALLASPPASNTSPPQ